MTKPCHNDIITLVDEANEGIITKITLKQITAQAPNGTTITRAPTNIRIWH